MDTPLTRSPGTALHRQLFLILRDQILRGVYAAGDMIPNEDALCAHFGVSRITLRRAVSDLEARGLLKKRHGRGTFVTATLPAARPAATLSLLDTLRKTATETEVEVLELGPGKPPSEIARQLDLLEGAEALRVVRLRSCGPTPVMVTEAWIPKAVSKRITAEALKKRALYQILMGQGVAFGRVVQEITAVAADPVRAARLNTEAGAPLLKLARLMYDTARRPVLYLDVYLAPERSRLLMDVSIEAVDTFAAGSIFHDVAPGEPGRRRSKANHDFNRPR